mgnify:FL=1
MRLLLAFCFCLFVLGSSYSQELVPFLKGDKYGYSDLDQRLVVEALYDDAFFMNNGIGIVKKGQSWGAVDSIGNVIADFKYQFIEIERANDKTYLVVKANKFYGLIDENGVEIIPCEYKDVAFWEEDFVGVNPSRCVVFDKKYKKVATVEDLSITFNKEQRILYSYNEKEVTFYSNRGKKFLKIKNYTEIKPIGSDFVIVEKEDAVTVVTSQGDIVEKSEKIDEVISDKGWLFLKVKGKWSLLNNQGQHILESTYDEIKIVNDQLIGGKIGRNYALFDYSGNKLTGFEFTRIDKYRSTAKYIKAYRGSDQDVLFADGTPTGIKNVFQVTEKTLNEDQVIFKELDWGVINFEGDTIISPVYDRVISTISGNYRVKDRNMYGLLSHKGDVLLETKYDELLEKDEYYLGIIDEEGFIFDLSGKLISSLQYGWGPQIKVPFNLFAVTDSEKLGVVNSEGKVLVPIEYDKIDSLSGLIIVSQDSNKYAYRLSGEKVLKEPYFNFERTDLWLKVTRRGPHFDYFGLYNLEENLWFLEPDWKDIKLFNQDRYFTLKSKIDYYGIADTSYKLLVKPMYDELRPYNNNSELYLKVTNQGYYLMRIDGSLVYEDPFELVVTWSGSALGEFIFEVIRDDKFGLMDYQGEMILDVEFEEIASTPRDDETYLRIGKDGKWGMINDKAEIIIQPIYKDISQLETGWFWVIENKDSKKYLIDPNGKAYSNHLKEATN